MGVAVPATELFGMLRLLVVRMGLIVVAEWFRHRMNGPYVVPEVHFTGCLKVFPIRCCDYPPPCRPYLMGFARARSCGGFCSYAAAVIFVKTRRRVLLHVCCYVWDAECGWTLAALLDDGAHLGLPPVLTLMSHL